MLILHYQFPMVIICDFLVVELLDESRLSENHLGLRKPPVALKMNLNLSQIPENLKHLKKIKRRNLILRTKLQQSIGS